MTLNITVAGRSAIFQSSDFCYAKWDVNAAAYLPVQEFGFKQEVFGGPSWVALVGFCGVAVTSTGIETGSWLAKQRQMLPFDTSSYDDFLSVLCGAQAWWGRIADPRPELTFIIAGFVAGQTVVSMVSDRARIDGHSAPTPGSHLFITTKRLQDTKVFAVGSGAALVSRNDRRHLVHLVDSGSAPDVVRRRLATINGRVARSLQSQGAVSEASMVTHLPIEQRNATYVPFGTADSRGDFAPPDATAILETLLATGAIKRRVNEAGNPLPLRLVQSATAFSDGPVTSLSVTLANPPGGMPSKVPTED